MNWPVEVWICSSLAATIKGTNSYMTLNTPSYKSIISNKYELQNSYFSNKENHFQLITSKRLGRRFLLLWLLCRRKYFCAWLATWVGVFVGTKFLEIPLQSPLPSFSRPTRNIWCSFSVHGMPEILVVI